MSIENEIRHALAAVEAAFSKLDIEQWLECFHPSRILVLPQLAFSPASAAECEQVLGGYIENLKAQGTTAAN